MPEFRHETERLILRDWREDDWPRFFTVTNTPEVMRWLGGVLDDAGMAAQRARVEGCAAQHGHCFWAVERRADGELLGFCGLKRADAPNSTVTGMPEIGWRLREDAWGQGYAKEAALASLDLAFGKFGAEEVVALTVADNTASWGLMERLGMRRRPELDYSDPRYDPPWRDTVVYSLARNA
jgi:RimJ/RimL family protein N-acetyltransferase